MMILLLRIEVIEAQLAASSRDSIPPPNHTSIVSLIAEYNKSSLDEELDTRFRKLSEEALTSLQDFFVTFITQRTDDMFEKILNFP